MKNVIGFESSTYVFGFPFLETLGRDNAVLPRHNCALHKIVDLLFFQVILTKHSIIYVEFQIFTL